jgi:hypothetical protein
MNNVMYTGPKSIEAYLQKKSKKVKAGIRNTWKYVIFSTTSKEKCLVIQQRKEDSIAAKFFSQINVKGFSDKLDEEENVLNSEFGFKIITTKKTFVLFASRKDEHFAWLRILNYHFYKKDIKTINRESTSTLAILQGDKDIEKDTKIDENKKIKQNEPLKPLINFDNSEYKDMNMIVSDKNKLLMEEKVNSNINSDNKKSNLKNSNTNIINEKEIYTIEEKKNHYEQRLNVINSLANKAESKNEVIFKEKSQSQNILPVTNLNERDNTSIPSHLILPNSKATETVVEKRELKRTIIVEREVNIKTKEIPVDVKSSMNNQQVFHLPDDNINMEYLIKNIEKERNTNTLKNEKVLKLKTKITEMPSNDPNPKENTFKSSTHNNLDIIDNIEIKTQTPINKKKPNSNDNKAISNVKLSGTSDSAYKVNKESLILERKEKEKEKTNLISTLNHPYCDIQSISSKMLQPRAIFLDPDGKGKKIMSDQEKFYYQYQYEDKDNLSKKNGQIDNTHTINYNNNFSFENDKISNDKQFVGIYMDDDTDSISKYLPPDQNEEMKKKIYKESQKTFEFMFKKMNKQINDDDWGELDLDKLDTKKQNLNIKINPLKSSNTLINTQEENVKNIKIHDFKKGVYDDAQLHIKNGEYKRITVENVNFLNDKNFSDKSLNNASNVSHHLDYKDNINIKEIKDIQEINVIKDIKQEKVLIGEEYMENNINTNTITKSVNLLKNLINKETSAQSLSHKNNEVVNKVNIVNTNSDINFNKDLKLTTSNIITQKGKKFNIVKKVFGSSEGAWDFIMKVPNKLVQSEEKEKPKIKQPIEPAKNSHNLQENLYLKNLIGVINKEKKIIDLPEEKFEIKSDNHHMHVQETFQFEKNTVIGDDWHLPLSTLASNVKQEKIPEENISISVINEKNFKPIEKENLESRKTLILDNSQLGKQSYHEEELMKSVVNISSIVMNNYSMLDAEEDWDYSDIKDN